MRPGASKLAVIDRLGLVRGGGFNLKLHIYLIMEGGNGLKRLETPTLDQEYVDLERVLASKASLYHLS